jgi:hypothetical protein
MYERDRRKKGRKGDADKKIFFNFNEFYTSIL